MPPKSNSPDVVRTALTRGEMRRDLMPAEMSEDKSVVHAERPRRGHDY
jgi:hypothetical protein